MAKIATKYRKLVPSNRKPFSFFSETKYTIYNHTPSFDLKQNNLLTTLPYLGKEYEILFQLKITNIASAAYQSVLHLSVDGTDVGVYGSRSPAMWVTPNKKFHVSSAISGNKNNWANIPGAKLHEWLSIEISQTLRDKKVNVDKFSLFLFDKSASAFCF